MAAEDLSTDGAYVTDDSGFTRDTDYITTRMTADGRDGYPVEPGRYRLIAARACPWAIRPSSSGGCLVWRTLSRWGLRADP